MDSASLPVNEYLTILEQTKNYLLNQQQQYGDEIFLNADINFAASERKEFRINTLEDLKKSIQHCQACPLSRGRNKVVLGDGRADADIILVGEAPGYFEDQQGKPFVGEAGKLLDKILKAINLSRNDIYITNVVKCRPPNNRDPNPEEWGVCRKVFEQQIGLIKPRFMLVLGRIAANYLLGQNKSLKDFRGAQYKIYGTTAIVTYHPAALLRDSDLKYKTWEDVQQFQKLYEK